MSAESATDSAHTTTARRAPGDRDQPIRGRQDHRGLGRERHDGNPPAARRLALTVVARPTPQVVAKRQLALRLPRGPKGREFKPRRPDASLKREPAKLSSDCRSFASFALRGRWITVACDHSGAQNGESRYLREAGQLRLVLVCDACGAECAELQRV